MIINFYSQLMLSTIWPETEMQIKIYKSSVLDFIGKINLLLT